MNRHKAFWSVMGIEPSTSVKQTDFENFEQTVKIMMAKYGTTDVLSSVRKTYETVEREV